MRVVLDTNVIVSATLSPQGTPARVLSEIRKRDDIAIVVAEALLDEYRRALSYPHVQRMHGLSQQPIDMTLSALRFQAVLVDEDSDDNLIVACAIGGSADFIVSGDRHLLRLRSYRDVRILSPAAFLALVSAGG